MPDSSRPSQSNPRATEYGWCSGCRRLHALKKDGTVRRHVHRYTDIRNHHFEEDPCRGVGKTPIGNVTGRRTA